MVDTARRRIVAPLLIGRRDFYHDPRSFVHPELGLEVSS